MMRALPLQDHPRPPTGRPSAWRAVRPFAASLLEPQVSSAARERRDVLVLLLAIAFVVLPHFEHLPWWTMSVLTALWLWRFWLTVAQRELPGHLVMLPLLVAATAGIWIEHRTLLGRDAGVAFLLLLMALKLLEMRARRDVFVVIFLAFFILLTQFLFDQGLPIALLTLAAVIALFFVLVSVHLTDADLPAARKLRLVGLITLKAVPLAIVLFLLFPRLAGPLWGMPGDAQAGRTGLSNSMSPGTISQLLESNQIAFRVRFEGAPPANDRLYWRGPVFGAFNGRTWSPLSTRDMPATPLEVQPDPASAVDYVVTLEPSQRDWLFALDLPLAAPTNGEMRPRLAADGQLLASELVTRRARYAARSFTRYAVGLNETEASLRNWLALPSGFNPRTLQFAAELRNRSAARDGDRAVGDLQFVRAALDHLQRNGFQYTLKPPLLGRHAVDEFLFDTRQGYCEHYASTFVVLMRAAGIPARVVTGYQGGELNPIDGFMTVRQLDAHAWAEVWLAGRGWTRVDPTSVVAPTRIEQGAEEIARQAGVAPLFGGGAVGQGTWMRWIRSVRFNWEALQNTWNQWVLTYSAERQRSLLTWLGFEPDWRAAAILLAIAFPGILLVLAFFSLRHRSERDPLAELFDRFRGRLLDAGIRVAPSDGPRALDAKLARELAPASRVEATRILLALERWRYSPSSQSVPRTEVRVLRAAVRRFRPTLA